jgi:hypothetical protein
LLDGRNDLVAGLKKHSYGKADHKSKPRSRHCNLNYCRIDIHQTTLSSDTTSGATGTQLRPAVIITRRARVVFFYLLFIYSTRSIMYRQTLISSMSFAIASIYVSHF